jgi:pyruvate kinase
MVPTQSGATARSVARFRLPTWIAALSPNEAACQALQFSYGIHAIAVEDDRADWAAFVRQWLGEQGVTEGMVLLTPDLPESPPNHLAFWTAREGIRIKEASPQPRCAATFHREFWPPGR